ncbi:TOMM precursor leader peptide-binding protein [Streptomyces johnsoniae]|uniref:TOMM leader peptide-binding protein n=1 Tax=Streptomyces johnsoniae TaxID=3075532 RepID=A0ABU2S811_9ACTN|nr:TOMM precursor leader peptide-binding protein [Streptomyces sp. DSM 41886]MDT0445075.1 TOMM precursor leader peptide-binding protein [Streptomyces sp. DSM 41886]
MTSPETMPTRARICVLGSGGALYDAVLARSGGTAGPRTLLVAVHEGWDTALHDSARRTAADHGIGWLPVRTELSHAVVGPLEVPGGTGCADCATARARRVRPDQDERDAVRRRHGRALAATAPSWLTGTAAGLVAGLVAEEAERLSGAEPGAPRTRRALLRVALDDLSVTRHPFLPEPLCEVCGDVPADTAEGAVPALKARPAHRPGRFRARPLRDALRELTDAYVDDQVGLIASLDGHRAGGLVVTSAPVGFRTGRRTAGRGHAPTARASRLSALLGAVERYGNAPGGRSTAVTATFRELGDRALDPRAADPFAPEPCQDRPRAWVWGWSFARRESVLVPQSLAYRDPAAGGQAEGPGGSAVGGSLEEAILHGLLQAARWDALLMTWYARLAAAEIDLAAAADRAVPLLAATVRAETGYRVRAFDVSAEQGIPCVWALAENPAGNGGPAVACAGGAHPDPEKAIRRALHDLGPALAALLDGYAEAGAAELARRMAQEPELVRTAEQHALLYGDPGAAARLRFLTSAAPSRKPVDIGAERGGFAGDDLLGHLLEAVGRYTARGMDVVVVDQTAAEHAAGGLACVNVLVPGTVPLTYGHARRRVDRLRRLAEVPVRLGHRTSPLPPADVNPHPHPFGGRGSAPGA